ncbi:hypothetical protein GQ44DRAFT_634625, partial [Phaeosphaeriaceae sp. PMI808]
IAKPINIEYIGWEDDFRYANEKARITEHIREIAETHRFAYTCIQDMIIRYRYRSQGPWVDVHLKRQDWLDLNLDKYVFTRLWFNKDSNPEKELELQDIWCSQTDATI